MINYIKGTSQVPTTAHILQQTIDGERVPIVKQTPELTSAFVNKGILRSGVQQRRAIDGGSSQGGTINDLTPLVEIVGSKKSYYLIIEAKVTGIEGLSDTVSEKLYVQSAYIPSLTVYELTFDSETNIVTVPTSEGTLQLPPSTIYAGIVSISSFSVNDAYNANYRFTDPIPVALLGQNEQGICVTNVSSNRVSGNPVMHTFSKRFINSRTCIAADITLEDISSSVSDYLTLEDLKPFLPSDGYVVFSLDNASQSTIYLTQDICFDLLDTPRVQTLLEGYVDSTGNVNFYEEWMHSAIHLISNLVDGPDGRCIPAEDHVTNASSTKLVFFDTPTTVVGSLNYEDFVENKISFSSVDGLRTYAQNLGAKYVCVNWYCGDGNDTIFPVVYVSGACHETTKVLSVSDMVNDVMGASSNTITYNSNTHVFFDKSVQAPSCINWGHTVCECAACKTQMTTKYKHRLAHNWGTPTYEWEGNSHEFGGPNKYWCVAKRVCSGNGTAAHEESFDGSVSHVVVTEPSLVTDSPQHNGTMRCIATFPEATWAVTQTKTFTMLPRLLAPTHHGLGLAGTDDLGNQIYTLSVSNPNPRFSDYEGDRVTCYFTLYDEDGSEVYSSTVDILPGGDETVQILLGSSYVADRYSMFLRYYKKSDSVTVTGFRS